MGGRRRVLARAVVGDRLLSVVYHVRGRPRPRLARPSERSVRRPHRHRPQGLHLPCVAGPGGTIAALTRGGVGFFGPSFPCSTITVIQAGAHQRRSPSLHTGEKEICSISPRETWIQTMRMKREPTVCRRLGKQAIRRQPPISRLNIMRIVLVHNYFLCCDVKQFTG